VKPAMSNPRKRPGQPRGAKGRFVKVRKNGQHQIDAASTMRVPAGLSRIIRPQASYRWLAPGIAAFTPRYIEMILNGALSGDHVMQWQLFDLMLDTWPTLSACQQELLYGVLRREIIFDPYTEEDQKATPTAIDREKLVSTAIQNMDPDPTRDESAIGGTIADIMDAWFRGVSVLEIVWQNLDHPKHGQIWTPQSTFWAHPSTYGFSPEGIIGLMPQVPYGYATTTANPPFGYASTSQNPPSRSQSLSPFPDNKFLIAIHKVRSGTPLGGPMLRSLAWWWCASNFTSDWLLNLAQVFGLPFRWATYVGASPDQTVAAICDMLQNMGSAGWAAFPEGTTLELKEANTGTTGHTPQGDLLERADHYARQLILGQTMTGATIASGRGGQAFGTVEAQLKQDRLDAACSFVAEVINRQLIPAILNLNYGEAGEPPSCRFLQETEGTYQDAQRDQILATLGLDIPLSHLRHKYNIPEATGGEPTVTPPPPKPPSSFSTGPAGTRPITQTPAPLAKTPRQVQARLEELEKIEDNEIFGREFKKFAAEIATKENQ